VRNAVGEIDRAINRVDHPARRRLRIAQSPFFAEDGNFRMGLPEQALDAFLTSDIELELDVVQARFRHPLFRVQILAHDFARRLRRPHRTLQRPPRFWLFGVGGSPFHLINHAQSCI